MNATCAATMIGQRQREVHDLPEPQGHQRHDQEQRQRDVAQVVDRPLRQPDPATPVVEVPDGGRHQHRADVGRQRQPDRRQHRREPRADDAADPDGHQQHGQRLQQQVGFAVFACRRGVRRLGTCSSTICSRRVGDLGVRWSRGVAQAMPRDEPRADRPANQPAGDDADHRGGHRQRRRRLHARLPRTAARTRARSPVRRSA